MEMDYQIINKLRRLENNFWQKHSNIANPSVIQYDYLTLISLKKALEASSKFVKSKRKKKLLDIIDIGSGSKPYEPLFKSFCKKYVGVDIQKPADIIASGENLPFSSKSFDLALCFQVLEHVENPQKVVDEIHRVLNKSGRTILTTHGIWYFHPGPHDYHRWTHEGLEKLFDKFSEVKVWPTIKSYSTVIQLINIELYSLSARNIFLKIPLYVCILTLNILGKLLLSRGNNHISINYLVLAKK